MSEAVECPRRGKLFRGCRFEGRYDSRPGMNIHHHAWDDPIGLLRNSRISTYVRDVCVTCGRTIERSSPTLQSDGA